MKLFGKRYYITPSNKEYQELSLEEQIEIATRMIKVYTGFLVLVCALAAIRVLGG